MHRHRAEDDAADPGGKIAVDVGHRANAAAELNLQRRFLRNRKENICVHRMAFAGAVEIHHVDPLSTGSLKLARCFERILRHLMHGVEAALIQAHRRAVFDVNRW